MENERPEYKPKNLEQYVTGKLQDIYNTLAGNMAIPDERGSLEKAAEFLKNMEGHVIDEFIEATGRNPRDHHTWNFKANDEQG